MALLCDFVKTCRLSSDLSLQSSPGSRYIHLAWSMFEKAEGNLQNARDLLERGHELNPNDAAILQV